MGGIQNVTLELGGKSPLIIFDDANLKNAVKGALMANFLSQGEVCSNGTRVFIQRGIYDKFVAEFVRQAKNMKVGDPMNEDTTVGGTISEDHAKKVLGYVDLVKKEGAKVECGEERVIVPGECVGGWYLTPAVVTDCQDDMRFVQEEVLTRANKTTFGLAAGVFTQVSFVTENVGDT